MLVTEMDACGTHGTSASRADSIINNGFALPNVGGGLRRGTGCYFWEHYYGSDFALLLAKIWWEYSHDKGQYRDDDKPQCAVIVADISFSDDRFLDFQAAAVKQAFMNFIKSIEDSVPEEEQGDEFKLICKKYDMFLDLIEEKSGKDYHVFRVQIPIGNNRKLKETAQVKLLGEPIALVVKETSCIKSLKVEHS